MDPRDQAWLDDDEYPDEKDMEEFGDDAPADFEPQTIGFVGDWRPPFWTGRRIVILIVGAILIAILVLPFLFRWF